MDDFVPIALLKRRRSIPTTWTLTNNGSTLTLPLNDATPQVLVGTAVANVPAGAVAVVSGLYSGTGGLTVTGGGTLILTAANTYTGTTTIDAGSTLALGNGGALGGFPQGSYVVNGDLIFNFNTSINLEWLNSNAVSGGGAIRKKGSGTIIPRSNGQGTFSGTLYIDAGTWRVSHGSNNGDSGKLGWAHPIVNNAALIFGTYGGTFANPISGSGTVQVGALDNYPSTYTFIGSNTYTGTTTVAYGTLTIGNGGTLGTGPVIVNAAQGGTLAFNRSDSVTVSNAISGAGRLTKLGGGTTTLTGACTCTGNIAVQGGTLVVGATGSLSGVANVDITGGATLDIFGSVAMSTTAGTAFSVGTGVLNTTGFAIVEAGGSLTIPNNVGFLVGGSHTADSKMGVGTFTNWGTVTVGTGSTAPTNDSQAVYMNSYGASAGISTINLNGGTFTTSRMLSAGNSSVATAVVNFNGGALKLGASITSVLNGTTVNLLVGGAAIDSNGFNATQTSAMTGAGAFTKTGGGTLTLGAANSYAGGTTINTGAITIGNVNSLGTGAVLVNAAGTLNKNGLLPTNSISGSGTINA